MVLSNTFKGLLLSSYVNIEYDLAVKSLQELIDNPSIEIIYDNSSLRYNIKRDEIDKLLKRPIQRAIYSVEIFSNDKDIAKFRSGKMVILCNSYNCPFHIAMNPHLQLANADGYYFHSFGCLKIKKTFTFKTN